MKRFEQIPARSELGAAARFVVGNRLDKLRQFVSTIATSSGDDVEAIHQLRVYCRRAHAAADILADAIPAKHAHNLRKNLHKLRRAAGKIRDCDVLAIEIEAIRKDLREQETPAADFLEKSIPKRRVRFRRRLGRKIQKLRRKGFWDWVDRHYPAIDSMEHLSTTTGHERGLADLAREKLPGELDAFLSALSTGPHADYEQLHQVRIAAKRLRYVVEVFAGCFPSEYRADIYNPIKRVQDSLGAINDAHTFALWFDKLARTADQEPIALGFTMLRDRYRERLVRLADHFTQLWSEEQRREYSDRFHAILVAIDDIADQNSPVDGMVRDRDSSCPNPS